MIKVNCDYCFKEFEVYPSRLENTDICCSRGCAANLKKAKKETNVICYVCNKPFYLKPSHLALRKYKDKVTCSRECKAKIDSERMTGEGNHQYGLKGEDNASFKSGIRISSYGYVLIKDSNHPRAWADGYIPIHRLIMEEFLLAQEEYEYLENINGRYVLSSEYEVHHIDENKLNNSIANLEVLYGREHKSIHGIVNYQHRTVDILGRLQPKIGLKSGKVSRANSLDAGMDVYATEEKIIKAGNSSILDTDLRIDIPPGQVGLLWSRSGLSCKYNIEVGAGCIDSGYQGEIKVHLYNHGLEDYKVKAGDKIAQLLILDVNISAWETIADYSENSDRGNNGFGSTGK